MMNQKNKIKNIFHQKKNKSNESVRETFIYMLNFGYYISHNFH
jgi:hypothetical protein